MNIFWNEHIEDDNTEFIPVLSFMLQYYLCLGHFHAFESAQNILSIDVDEKITPKRPLHLEL